MSNKYICKVPYSDGYAYYEVGDEISVSNLSGRGEHGVWVFPEKGDPIQLEAFLFCFEKVEEA